METQILVSDYQTRRSPNSLVRLTLLMNIIRLVCGISSTEKTHLLGMAKKRQKQEQEISTSFKVFLTTWAFVENGLFSGLRAGWSALVYILKQEHIYADLCLGNTTGNSSKCICHGETSNTSDSYSCSSSSAPNFLKNTDIFLLSLAADCLISDSHIRNVHVCSRDTLRANFEQMLNPAYAFVNL